jgi:predicted Rossmann fold flavoprotein
VERRAGEVQFTDYGVSGIVIMQLSNYLEPGKRYELELDLFPQMEEEALLAFLTQKAKNHPDQRADFLLLGILKSQFSELLLRSCRVDGKKRTLGSLTEQELSNLARRVKHWRMKVQEPLTWEQAQVTLGGVALDQVDMTTFRSRNVPGLYFTGELLDVAGDCGGFNLAWAFGSGVVAARSALAERI